MTVAELNTRLNTLEPQVQKLVKTIYGNGEIGMDEQIRQIFAWITDQKAEKAWWKSEAAKYIFWAVTVLGGDVLIRLVLGT
jgi:hypothetical protein